MFAFLVLLRVLLLPDKRTSNEPSLPDVSAASSTALIVDGAVGVCITGQLARLELDIKVANILRPLAEATGQSLDIAFALDSDTHGTKSVDRYPSPSAVDPAAALFSSEDAITRALAPYRGESLIRTIVFGKVAVSLASEASASSNGSDNSAALRLKPAVRQYAQRLGPKVGISRVARAAIHLRQYEIMSTCDELLRKAAARHGQQPHQLLVRLREDVVSPLPVPAREIVQMLRNATRRGVGAIVTSDLEPNGGVNDKGAFLNAIGRRDYFAAPLEALGGGLPRQREAFEHFATRRVNGRELNPETLLWNIYARRGLSMLTVHTLLAPLRLGRPRDGTYLEACAKVCARVYSQCPMQVGGGDLTEPVALIRRGRSRSRRVLLQLLQSPRSRVDAWAHSAHELLSSLRACHNEGANRRQHEAARLMGTTRQPADSSAEAAPNRSAPYWQSGWLLRGGVRTPLARLGNESDQEQQAAQQPTLARAMADLEPPRTPTVGRDEQLWALADLAISPTRNHDCLVLDDLPGAEGRGALREDSDGSEPTLVNFLGRWSRAVASWNLQTGEQTVTVTRGVDPAGFPLADLNHVYAVPVDALDGAPHKHEVWLPCGFHGDRVNDEVRGLSVHTC